MAMLQERIPSVVRGRVSSLWLIQGNLSPALGGLQIGWLTERIWFGGALLVSAAGAGLSAGIVSYRAQKDRYTTGQDDK
jgi:ENTS family enterobactin (siderophore) exporter